LTKWYPRELGASLKLSRDMKSHEIHSLAAVATFGYGAGLVDTDPGPVVLDPVDDPVELGGGLTLQIETVG
jgi:hypothetical protein